MAQCYNILRLAQSRGTARYLAGLRAKHLHGSLSLPRFAYLAGRAYLTADKPRRAMALLRSLQPSYRPGPSLEFAADLLIRAMRSAEKPDHPGCSLIMITKNEEANIRAVLDTADDLADEIVLCDTGSADETVRLALLFGAVLITRPWDGDFSAARNATIDAATGDWIFWLDADDRLEAQSTRRIADIVSRPAGQCALLRIVNQTGTGGCNEFLQARIFPRRPGIRFERRIHEQIMPSIKRAGIPFARYDQVRIIHTGYDDPQTHRRKALRNRGMIEDELRLRPDEPSLQLSLGDACAITGDNAAAIDAYRSVTDNPATFPLNPDIYVQAQFHIAAVSSKGGDNRTAKKHLYRCLYADPSRIEAFVLLGSILKHEGDSVNAARMYLRALKIAPPVRTTATDNEKMQKVAISDLAGLLLGWRRFTEAKEILAEAVARFPAVIPFHTMLGQVLQGLDDPVGAVRCFMQAIALAPMSCAQPYRGVARVYEMLGEKGKSEKFQKLADECEEVNGSVAAGLRSAGASGSGPQTELSAG